MMGVALALLQDFLPSQQATSFAPQPGWCLSSVSLPDDAAEAASPPKDVVVARLASVLCTLLSDPAGRHFALFAHTLAPELDMQSPSAEVQTC